MKSGFRQLLFLYLAQASNLIVPLVVTPLIVSGVGVDGYGRYAKYMAFIQLSTVLTEFGFDLSGPRKLVENRQDSHSIYFDVFLSKMLLVLICAALYLLLFLVGIVEFEFSFFLSMLLWQVGVAMQATWWCVCSGKVGLNSISTVLSRGVMLIGIWLSLRYELGSDFVLLVTAFTYFLCGLVVFVALLRQRAGLFRNLGFYGEVLRSSYSDFMSVAAGAALNYVPVISLGLLAGDKTTGVYASIDRLARVVSSALKPVFQFIYPRAVKFHTYSECKRVRVTRKVMLVWMIFAFFTIATVVLFGHDFVLFLLGRSVVDSDGGLILAALVGWVLVGILNNLIGIQGLVAGGNSRLYARGMWFGTVLNFAVVVAAVMVFRGSSGVVVANAVLVGEVLITSILLVVGWKVRPWIGRSR